VLTSFTIEGANHMPTVWQDLEADCLKVLSLPHNVIELKRKGKTPAEEARKKVAEVQSGLGGAATKREFTGPRLFLRVVGPSNRAYGGEWWFDPDVFHRLEAAYARIYFQSPDKKAAIRDMLRELLAITTEWNEITEVWALGVPSGERITGYVGRGAPQQLFANRPRRAPGNRMLVGMAEQVFFPVKNPLWVNHYHSFRA
jgi:hypothetical protein